MPSSVMLDADYLRRQAEVCLTISRATFDLGTAGRLRALADELSRKAAEIEREEFDTHAPRASRARRS